jgi:hypothetical protein
MPNPSGPQPSGPTRPHLTNTAGLDGMRFRTPAEVALEPASPAAHRVGWGFISLYTLAFIGTNLVFLAPLLVTLPLKVNSLVGIDQAPNSLAIVAGAGALDNLRRGLAIGSATNLVMTWSGRRGRGPMLCAHSALSPSSSTHTIAGGCSRLSRRPSRKSSSTSSPICMAGTSRQTTASDARRRRSSSRRRSQHACSGWSLRASPSMWLPRRPRLATRWRGLPSPPVSTLQSCVSVDFGDRERGAPSPATMGTG